MNTSQFDANPDKVDHWTPESHWCGDCWSWVVDCEHVVEPLLNEHYVVDDGWIRSLAYDRITALEKLIMKNRRSRFDEVRTDGKLLASLLRAWKLIS
jgi:hypothetical protein